MTDEQLLDAGARRRRSKAYAPYSKFHVGCAIEFVDGEVVTGANMENACYRLGICAEQSALTAAQHKFGLDKVARIAVVGGTATPTVLHAVRRLPPGDPRSRPAQRPRRRDHVRSGDGSAVERHRIGELIPFGFGPRTSRQLPPSEVHRQISASVCVDSSQSSPRLTERRRPEHDTSIDWHNRNYNCSGPGCFDQMHCYSLFRDRTATASVGVTRLPGAGCYRLGTSTAIMQWRTHESDWPGERRVPSIDLRHRSVQR